jgi:hypothetical protein
VSTVRNWIVVVLVFCVTIRLGAWLITPVVPLVASLVIFVFVVGLLLNRTPH